MWRIWRIILHVNFLFAYPIYLMLVCISIYCYLLLFSSFLCRSVMLCYGIYIILDETPRVFGRWNERETLRRWSRNNISYKLVRNLIDIRLVRVSPMLDPKHSYIFSYHPHGIIGLGVNAALATDACNFPSVFPGIKRSTCTLNASFLVPFAREWFLANGFISANKKTIVGNLKRGQSIVIVPGGASEATHTKPGTFRLVLSQRKGFLRVARETGAYVVPCLGFGENEQFNTFASSVESRSVLQTKLIKFFTFSLPLCMNIFPLKGNPITVVTGKPIKVDCRYSGRGDDTESIEKFHSLYCKSIKELFDLHKRKYGAEDINIEII